MQELSGSTVTANSLMGGIDEVFQRTDSAGARSFLINALGSSIALADSSGSIQTQYIFDPFGNTTSTGTGTTNSFAYTGRELDATGLYFNRARYYNPQLQRFISEDPVRFSGKDVNLYAYVGNSAPNYIDPSGTIKSCSLSNCGIFPSLPDLFPDLFPLTRRKPAIDDNDPNHHLFALKGGGGGRSPARGGPPNGKAWVNDGLTCRFFDCNGDAAKDVDYGHDHGAGDPHVHDWDWSQTPPRQPGRAPYPGEPLGQ